MPPYVTFTGEQLMVAVVAFAVILAGLDFLIWQGWWWFEDRRDAKRNRPARPTIGGRRGMPDRVDSLLEHTVDESPGTETLPVIPREFDHRPRPLPWDDPASDPAGDIRAFRTKAEADYDALWRGQGRVPPVPADLGPRFVAREVGRIHGVGCRYAPTVEAAAHRFDTRAEAQAYADENAVGWCMLPSCRLAVGPAADRGALPDGALVEMTTGQTIRPTAVIRRP
jgi:hypothetical protein